MRKLLLTIISVIFMITSVFSQTFINVTKNEVISSIKEKAMKIEKPEKAENGFYSITAKFQNYSTSYSFTDENVCYFYIIVERYYGENYFATCKYFDERYHRAFDDPCTQNKKTDVWKIWNKGSWVYSWIICNLNTGIQYTIYLPQENYEANKYSYIQKLLGSN